MLDSKVPPHSNQSRVKTGKREPKFEEAGKKRAALFHVHAGVETRPGCQATACPPPPKTGHVQTDNRPDGSRPSMAAMCSCRTLIETHYSDVAEECSSRRLLEHCCPGGGITAR